MSKRRMKEKNLKELPCLTVFFKLSNPKAMGKIIILHIFINH